ncbi:hypothetical protein FACHB389_07260 [Nostoc calcicola FACHB-389]|nr:hypothetical protein FACHB389_07260 [Nostoc calcicola FACHB-389]
MVTLSGDREGLFRGKEDGEWGNKGIRGQGDLSENLQQLFPLVPVHKAKGHLIPEAELRY